MKVLVFVEGTILKPASDDKKKDFSSYLPISKAVKKLNNWIERGAELSYLTSRTKFAEILDIQKVLKKFEFPEAKVLSRHEDEEYKEVVEELKPHILVEDDCQSIGEDEIITPKLNPELNIHGIVLPEFEGIDLLPDDPEELKDFGKKQEPVEEEED